MVVGPRRRGTDAPPEESGLKPITARTDEARDRPLVSIGVPVYNAAAFLRPSLDSLLAQTVGDMEIIIADNASSDATQAICEDYAGRDPRIRYVRQPRNLGIARNWNWLVAEARGEFFKWAPGNDYCAPVMLERCLAALRSDPGAVLSYGQTQLVDQHDRPIGLYARDVAITDTRPSERFARVCRQLALNNMQCGLIRLRVLRRTLLNRSYPGSDLAMMAELALYGRFLMVPEVLMYRRQSHGAFTRLLSGVELARMYKPGAKRPIRFPSARRHLGHLAAIARSPIPLPEKYRATAVALRLVRWDRVALWRELIEALRGEHPAP